MQNKTVILVDDDPITNLVNEEIIRQYFKFNVVSFDIAKVALGHLKATSNADLFPDIILLDINMPFIDGWEFLEELQKLPEEFSEKCNVFMLTSSIDHGDIEKSETFKLVKGFITKPLTADKLMRLITRHPSERTVDQ